MSKRSRNRAFALIELPLVLLFLAVNGLLIAYVFSLFSGPAPWYAWVIAALILPAEALSLGVVGVAVESLGERRARKRGRSTVSKAQQRHSS